MSRLTKRNITLPYLMLVLPGTLWLLLFRYLPMFGVSLAFKDFRYSRRGFLDGLRTSPWVGFENFAFLFQSNDAQLITRNTIAYNLVFILLGLVVSVAIACALHLIHTSRAVRFYQTAIFMPYFISWVVVSYFVYSVLSPKDGLANALLTAVGWQPVSWYTRTVYWPFILVFMHLWKNVGYGMVIYLAAIAGIPSSLYEAAALDGVNRRQRTWYITLPHLVPLMITLTLLAIGKIFYADFGLFYQVPRNSGALFSVTNVIDTYVFRGLIQLGDIGMATAAGLYQSTVGLVLILSVNALIKKVQPDYALF